MNYSQWHKIFQNKVKRYDAHLCKFALQDCHDTLSLRNDLPIDDPYCLKLWAEIDALRERQLEIGA
jgi:hypothetical protein